MDSNGNASDNGNVGVEGAEAVYVNTPGGVLQAEYRGSVHRDHRLAAWFQLSWQIHYPTHHSDWIGLYYLGE